MSERPYSVRDPIHGLIELSEEERKLIDTTAFQRLRRIRQLAMAFLVYPSAMHTRFEHSIGVMHIVGRICSKLLELKSHDVEEKDIDLMRYAALLHDIGHGPFSHVSEGILDLVSKKNNNESIELNKIHEKVTIDIIQTDPEITSILNDEERNSVVKLIQDKDMRDWKRNVISSELDADKMDYLLRDAYYAGVKYGQYDLEQIIESCRIEKDRNTTLFVISNEGIYALEQLLLARYHMTQQVYWHRVSLISSQMIIRGITLAIEEGNNEMNQLYQYDETNKEDFVERYLKYHDEKVIDIMMNCDQNKACQIFNRLYSRDLFKMIAELPLKDIQDERVKSRLLAMPDTDKQRWEKAIAEYLNLEAEDVIIHKRQIPNPGYGTRSKILDPESIKILDEKTGILRNIKYYASELSFVRSTDTDDSLETIHVYAPFKLTDQNWKCVEDSILNIFQTC